MPLASQTSGLCSFCAFKASQSLRAPFQRNSGVRYSTESGFRLRRIRPNALDRILGGQNDKQHAKKVKPPSFSHPQPTREHAPHNVYREAKTGRRTLSLLERTTGTRHIIPVSSAQKIRMSKEERKIRQAVGPTETTYGVFGRLLLEQAQSLQFALLYKESAAVRAWGINSNEELQKKLELFEDQLRACTRLAEEGKVRKEENPLFFRLRKAFITGNKTALSDEMKFAFINEVVEAKCSDHHRMNQEKLADLRYPLEWFPATRALQRTVHLHIGPTNSGKTYHALQKLEAASSGVYAGPLRLLAHEVYTRLNAKGKPCALITGEERRIPENYTNQMSSCTVEMVPLNAKIDVAVIDEIQMMGDKERGWAWTQAFLGLQAKEVHVCGEVRTKKIVTDLCAAMGDKLVVHEYQRLSPLSTQHHSLNGNLRNLQKGDAIILFSRVAIHAMKSNVEMVTGRRCAVVYGSLPPETRAQQAALFNDPNNDYDYLVASDAVGMGLNLSIKRVIFESTSKNDGSGFRLIAPSEIKQIAGRAGRYKTAQDAIQKGQADVEADVGALEVDAITRPSTSVGLVTTLERFDLPIVQRAMNTEVEPLKSVGIFPPTDILLRFANYFPPKTPFSYIVLRLHDMASLNSQFHLCGLKDQIKIADLIQKYDLSNMDRITLMSAPISLRDAGTGRVVEEMAHCIAEQKNASLTDLKTLDLELLDKDIHDHKDGSKGYLREAEVLHRAITLYLWLSYRFAGVFVSQALAFHVKGLIETKIDECLAQVQWSEQTRRKLSYLKQKAIKESVAEGERIQAASGAENRLIESEYQLAEGAAVTVDPPETGKEMEIIGEDGRDRVSNIAVDDHEMESEDEDEELNFSLEEPFKGLTTGSKSMEEAYDPDDLPSSDGNIHITPEQQSDELGRVRKEAREAEAFD